MSVKENLYAVIFLYLKAEKIAFFFLAICVIVSFFALYLMEPRAEYLYTDYYHSVKKTRGAWALVLVFSFLYVLAKSVLTIFVGHNIWLKLVRKVVTPVASILIILMTIMSNLDFDTSQIHVLCKGYECRPFARIIREEIAVLYAIDLIVLYVLLTWENRIIRESAEKLVRH